MAEQNDWLAESLEAYRRARQKLDRHKDDERASVQYLIEDLREALLDLKQATIAEDQLRAVQNMNEISFLLAQLTELTQE